MILLLGLEGDVIITLPTPTLLAQMQRERQQLLKMVDGLKIESDSLRRERDDIKAERDACQKVSVPLDPNGLYNVPLRLKAPRPMRQILPKTKKNSRVCGKKTPT